MTDSTFDRTFTAHEAGRLMAHLCVEAIDLRENTYNFKASFDELKLNQAERDAHPGNPFAGVMTTSYYTIDQYEACKKVCEAANAEVFTMPVYLLITSAINDVLDWARDTFGIESKPSAERTQWHKDVEAWAKEPQERQHA